MQAAMRSYAAAGAALLGASVVAVNPVTAPHLQQGVERGSNAAVQLTSIDAAADVTLADLENIPYNFIASIINLPYYEFSAPIDVTGPDAIASGELAYTAVPGVGITPIPEISHGAIGLFDNVLAYEGNFFLLDAVNVLGIDPGDPGKIAAFADILSGNPEVGSAVAGQLIPILEAELPLQAGCTAASAGGCPNPLEILVGSNQSTGFDLPGSETTNVEVPGYFSVPIQDFFSANGYTFPGSSAGLSTGLLNPVPVGEPIPPGFPYGTPTNPIIPGEGQTYEVLPWSGENVNFNDIPNASTAYFDYLTQNPADNPIMLPSLTDVTTDLNNLATGLFNTFNPFVPGTYCLICAPFVPGDTDLQTFLTSEFDQIGANFQAFITQIETFANDPAGEIAANFQAFIAQIESLFNSGAAATDVSPLLDPSALTGLLDPSSFTADLAGLLDPTALSADLAGLLGNSATDLTALLGGSGVDLFASILPDLATFLPF